MSGKLNRREFLKALGVSGAAGATLAGCDLPSTVTLEEGKEDVVSYLMPEEYVIPGVGVWYASTCTQCASGCGIHGRVREGRVLKLEGNPDSPLSAGRSCQMGQAGVQAHYNPDRITAPMMRDGGGMVTVTWDKAEAMLLEKLGGTSGDRMAWFTGTVSGHQRVMIENFMAATGSKQHYTHEVVNDRVWEAVCQDMLGDGNPRLRIDKAEVVLSLGADFMGASTAPVLFARQYAEFRRGKRGTLIQVEGKMSMTGGSADLWVPIRPGTEGVLALGLANYLLRKGDVDGSVITSELRQRIDEFSVERAAEITGVSGDRIQRIGKVLKERRPSLVIPGAAVQGQEFGYQATAAVMALNILLGNVGKTIEPGFDVPVKQLQAKTGGTGDLVRFAQAVKAKQLDVAFFYGSNPVYSAPAALGLEEQLANVPFKVAFSMFPDETTLQADLILPLASTLESWGSHMAAHGGDAAVVGMQQPLMEPLHADTRGFGDIMLSLLKKRSPDAYSQYPDFYAYLNTAMVAMKDSSNSTQGTAKAFWDETLQNGQLTIKTPAKIFSVKTFDVQLPVNKPGADFPLTLMPTARMGLFDGRHANLPWLQESPDQIAKVVWDSWAEIHPATAAKYGIKQGDQIRIESANGTITTSAYLFKGMHPDAIAVPLGQGHKEYGRYARMRGVNPLAILEQRTDGKTGELAMFATRVKVAVTGKPKDVVRLGASDVQMGRGFVRTVSVDTLRRTEGA